MKALGCPRLVAHAVGHALIQKDHMLGDESDGRKLAVVEIIDEHEGTTDPNFIGYEESVVAQPENQSNNKRLREDYGFVAVVSDDEPTPESPQSSPKLPNRLDLAYILAE
ncbi:hypothetical protein F443_06589 [Phytophthora nicotianae P1569]|uniref:Uncharacterized protein n=1 Tax=Phytophthora nicotianae P1569 TaxID=1317065 RepID=V9FEW1_PHYNI|nr:hypothetical protein F443_06589 [Phytophthora nicotianae P1569]